MKYEKVRSLQHTRAPLREIEQALVNQEIKVRELALLALSSILQHPDFPEDVLESFRRISYSRKVFQFVLLRLTNCSINSHRMSFRDSR